MSAPAFHKIDRDAVEAMAPGGVWTWTTHRGFVAVFHPDYADRKMFVTRIGPVGRMKKPCLAHI